MAGVVTGADNVRHAPELHLMPSHSCPASAAHLQDLGGLLGLEVPKASHTGTRTGHASVLDLLILLRGTQPLQQRAEQAAHQALQSACQQLWPCQCLRLYGSLTHLTQRLCQADVIPVTAQVSCPAECMAGKVQGA